MLSIDGSTGEGGGQILRTSLTLSLVTQEPVHLTNIRARRVKPGLLRQHLTAVRAATMVGRAEVKGAEIGSKEIIFRPGAIHPGDYTFTVGSAGSATLVLQTVLPALFRASAPSRLTLEGGTHNPQAPPFDFLARAYLPLIRRMGPEVTATLEQHGFYPAGGGRFHVQVKPSPSLARLDLLSRGEIRARRAVATVANLSFQVAMRELAAAARVLGWESRCFRPEVLRNAPGPGNVLTIDIESEHVTEVFTGFGERGVRAEVVAERTAHEARAYIESGAVAGEHLADQLLLPMALAGSGSFRTMPLSSHTTTHMALLETIIGTRIRTEPVNAKVWHVEVGG